MKSKTNKQTNKKQMKGKSRVIINSEAISKMLQYKYYKNDGNNKIYDSCSLQLGIFNNKRTLPARVHRTRDNDL